MAKSATVKVGAKPVVLDKNEKQPLAVWESPETAEIDLGQAQTANTNSNFDGTNFSS